MKKIGNKKLFMIICICILGISLVGGTVAYFVKEIFSVNGQNTITYGLDYYINYAKGQDIVATTLNPSSSYEGSPSSDIEFWKKDNTYDIYGHIYLDVNNVSDALSDSGALKYTVTYNNIVLSEGTVTNNNDTMLLTANIPLKTSKQLYTVHIWLDVANVSGAISNSELSLSVRSEATMKIMPIDGAANYIKNLYIYNNPTLINHSASGENYYYASDVSLMNDGFDGNSRTDSVTTGNIRYYGSTPDNYVYFNCIDYNNPSDSTCEKWRIIGVFDDKLKIIRDEAIGEYSWDNKTSGVGSSTTSTGSNDWNDSRLMMLLNPGYTGGVSGIYDYEGSLYWNAKSGECYSNGENSCDFTNNGLKNDTTRNMISNSTWSIGRTNAIGVYADDIYLNERTMYSGTYANVWTGKIGLMSPSDYGYAADLSLCNNNLGAYSNCASNNWLTKGEEQWFITAYSGVTYTVSSDSSGNLGHFKKPTNTEISVRPVVYLSTNIAFNGGNGTSDDPYVLATKENNNKLKNYITNLYKYNNPIVITHKDENNNKIADYYYSYMDEDRTWGLMNDGLGATVNDTTALVNGTQGNIRYYGKNPNNYIYFNCDDYNNQSSSTCERWRIIGIVDGKVKIIRDELIGEYVWDYDGIGEANGFDNNWHDSKLRVLLNNGYYNNNNFVTYKTYNTGDGSVQIKINFSTDKKGIKNDKTRSMMTESTWYLGGYDSFEIYANDMYKYERGDDIGENTNKTWIGNIGLMYPSDYGYASDLSSCGSYLGAYNSCASNNWVSYDTAQWLITPNSRTRDTFRVFSSGGVNGSLQWLDLGVRPTLYLDTKIVLDEMGDGSYNSPYQLKVN